MKEELTTHAFDTTYLFGWDWLMLPVFIGLLLFVWALSLLLGGKKESAAVSSILGILILFVGVLAMFVVNSLFMSDLDKDLLRSDVSEQLQVEELDIGSSAEAWHTGRGADGTFVKFALLERDGTENTYVVVMEK